MKRRDMIKVTAATIATAPLAGVVADSIEAEPVNPITGLSAAEHAKGEALAYMLVGIATADDPISGRIFDLRVLEKSTWATIAEKMNLSVAECQQHFNDLLGMIRSALVESVERSEPELREAA